MSWSTLAAELEGSADNGVDLEQRAAAHNLGALSDDQVLDGLADVGLQPCPGCGWFVATHDLREDVTGCQECA